MKLTNKEKQLVREYAKKLVEVPDYGDLSNFDPRVDKNKLKKQLNFIKTKVSPEGWKIIVDFVRGATGLNRAWAIQGLYNLMQPPQRPSISLSNLDSYSNKSLRNLLSTGDLEKIGNKVYFKGIPE